MTDSRRPHPSLTYCQNDFKKSAVRVRVRCVLNRRTIGADDQLKLKHLNQNDSEVCEGFITEAPSFGDLEHSG